LALKVVRKNLKRRRGQRKMDDLVVLLQVMGALSAVIGVLLGAYLIESGDWYNGVVRRLRCYRYKRDRNHRINRHLKGSK